MKFCSILLALSLSVSCASASKAPATYTPTTIAQYNLTQVIDASGILQTAAENAVPQKVLSVNSARFIVEFCITARTAIGAAPNGWYAVVKAAYDSSKSKLTPKELQDFGLYLSTFETVFSSFAPIVAK